ncbi:HIT family protein [Liquorilactobacillus oeni]|uniref:Diadenosine tetraphosphate (Ap4A) hydrolase n=1 Tax=Liquorilactobacillus oeni DSM 19972 TaxID=1423777 RepID=A0A0R1MAR9_9LACO|nr:HIT family protein [Liquorilactobacillus oeni]KRL05180.1 diadenosine tetraphosphate (Ap4A) hydrolase [Liquorilactobacillus oeni DSM 19972]
MKKKECIFCLKKENEFVLENKLAAAFWDAHPVSKGHLLIITKEHKDNFFELDDAEVLAINSLLRAGKKMLLKKYQPAGFNIGINVGKTAGQTVMHCHIHLIPRYLGDVPDPRGGIRKMLPAAHK